MDPVQLTVERDPDSRITTGQWGTIAYDRWLRHEEERVRLSHRWSRVEVAPCGEGKVALFAWPKVVKPGPAWR